MNLAVIYLFLISFPGDSSKQEGSRGQNGDSASASSSGGEAALRVPMTSSPSPTSPSGNPEDGPVDLLSQPPPTQSLTAESSQAKVAFMGAIGLWRVPEEEKQGKEQSSCTLSCARIFLPHDNRSTWITVEGSS